MADPDPADPPAAPSPLHQPTPDPTLPPTLPPLDLFTCPVCLELMWKPTIASPCAHASCFWCAHRAMDGCSPSACPLCRSRFAHQAAVCGPLHRFIGAAFPAEAGAREAEVLAEEASTGIASMSVGGSGDAGAPAPDDPLSPAAWVCAHPACARLVARPTALLCGHVVCAACVPAGKACPACGRVARAVGGGRAVGSGSGDGSGAAGQRPAQAASHPRPCRLLAEVVGGLFPAAYAARLAEADAQEVEEEGKEGTGGEAASAPSSSPPPAPAAPDAATTPPETAPAAHPPPAAARPFTHFGVGCDTCGAYPIVGTRFKCATCPESIGFDVCGECVAAGAGGGGGRFGQAHTPDHALEEVRPVRSFLHVIQAANPDLSIAQILALGAMGREFEEEEEEGEEEGRGGGGGTVVEEGEEEDEEEQEAAGAG